MPSREAFARREVVLNGAGGGSRCSLRVIRSTVAVSPPRPERATTAWAAPESQNGPPTAVASNGGVPHTSRTFQKDRGTKSSRSRSRSATRPSVGVCTRPAERIWRSEAHSNVRKRVRTAPHARSIRCRAAAACARAQSGSVSVSNASRTSEGDMALNRARRAGRSGR